MRLTFRARSRPIESNRRDFIKTLASGVVTTTAFPLTGVLAQQSQREDHYATGANFAATSTSRVATEAALWALDQGGNAADAYMTAALTQTVSEVGLTSIGGAFGIRFFDAKQKDTKGVMGWLGPAKDEPYDFDRQSPITQTGRAMPVPGFIAGVYEAHQKLGTLPWAKLFTPAIQHAEDGFLVNPKIIEAAKRRGANYPEGRKIWARSGQMLQRGQPLIQTEAAKVLKAVAKWSISEVHAGVV